MKTKPMLTRIFALLLSVLLMTASWSTPVWSEEILPMEPEESMLPAESEHSDQAEELWEEPSQTEPSPEETTASDEDQTVEADSSDEKTEDDPSVEAELPVEEMDFPDDETEVALPDEETQASDDETEPEPPIEEPEEPEAPDAINPDILTLWDTITYEGFAYVLTTQPLTLYSAPDDSQPLCWLPEPGAVLLAIAYINQNSIDYVQVLLLTEDYELIVAYAHADELPDTAVAEEEFDELEETCLSALVCGEMGDELAFVVPVQRLDFLESLTPEETPPEIVGQDEQPTDPIATEETLVQIGAFVSVSPQTRAFLGIDETAASDNLGDLFLGYFVGIANVQVETIERDALDRAWYRVCYMYGADDADGSLIWTAFGSTFVLASETQETDADTFSVTDYAFSELPIASVRRVSRASAQPMQMLSGNTGSFSAGQTKFAYSGHDSEYLQIATLKGYGAIYATPHYVDEHTVYCLEHTMNSPGVRDNATGPYAVVDLNGYEQTPGYSGIIYGENTMHAIGWVLRHTYPFMALDRYEDSCLEWSRVAGQFAIREVIKQMEGAQYVRDYWDMDNFYRASGQAPKEYLEYARWLAAEGIAHGSITGDISVSNKSVSIANGTCTCTVTLTTDADRIRISRSAGTIIGNTGGEDGSYYYLNSGDTITVSAPGSSFILTAESISSEEEEAYFLVGVPDTDIQKILIPQRGAPYPMKAITIEADIPYGSLAVTKTDANNGAPLSDAVFELLNGSGTVIGTQTTGADGVAHFADLEPGTYTVREKASPEGYLVAVPDAQTITIGAGSTATASFTDARSTSKIRIMKTDALMQEPLAGAEFTITRLSAAGAMSGVGSTIVIATDDNGIAQTDWLEWGRYRVEETKVPEHFVDNHFAAEIEAYENGKTYEIAVENEPTKGRIQLVKTDALDQTPIEGVQFDIYENDEYGSALAGTMTTDANGTAVSPPLRKGRYIVREHENPTGYVAELSELPAIVKPDDTTYLSAVNQPIQGRIRIKKVDQLTRKALSGAEFTITRVSGLPSHKGAGDGEVVAVITTDADGIALSPLLTYGTYRIAETKVPEHFVDAGFSTEVTIDVENLNTFEIGVENEPTKGWIRLTKTDRLNGNPIAGVQFDVYENDEYGTALACSIVTDKNGVAMTPPLRKGRYVVREHGETAGYVFEEIALDATVKSDETTELTVTNQPVQVRLKLYKRDADEYAGNPAEDLTVRGDGILTGAVFRVLAGEDIADRQGHLLYSKGDVVVDSVTTAGEDASVTTGPLWPGLYEITELTPPAGYQSALSSVLVDARDAAKQSTEAIVTYDGVVTNEILYGAFAIVKLLGSASSDPAPDRVEQPEPNAEFDVFLKSAGSYENAREFERDHIVTDKNGYAMTKPLPYGIYVLRQTKGEEGYEIKGPIDVQITGTESLVNPPIVTLSDQPIRYRLRFIKTDAEAGRVITLPGTTFKLKNAEGEYVTQTVYYPTEQEIDTFTTDETGGVTLPETVTWGLYFIEEITAPEGYLIRDEDFAVFVGNSGDKPGETYQMDIEIPNEPVKGRIVLEKKGHLFAGVDVNIDAYGNEVHTPVYEEGYLSGAVFEVRAAEAIIGRDGTVWYAQGELVDTLITTAEGAVSSKVLPLSRYALTEISSPQGYALDDTPHEIELRYADDHTALVQIRVELGNDFLPSEITLMKEKEILEAKGTSNGMVVQAVTAVPGESFVFGLFSAQDIRAGSVTLLADTLVATGATDTDGRLTFTGFFPHGEYVIRELSAPDGWKLNSTAFPVSLDPLDAGTDHIIHVSLAEPIYDELIYTHVTLTKTDITGEHTVPGALIEVRDDAGKVIYRAYTNENGEIPDIPVTPGSYTFREVLAPEGYALNEAEMTFTVNADGSITGNTTIRDDFTRVHLLKQNENGQPMGGVEFALLDSGGNTQMTAVSDKNGVIVFERIPYGSYTIVETQPLPGYFKADVHVELTVNGSFVNPPDPLAVVINHPMHIECLKVNTSGEPLPGVTFSLIDARTDTIVENAVSDEQGRFVFSRIDYGDWIIRETEAPEGYIRMEDVSLHVDEDFVQTEPITFVNVPDHFEFEKVDNHGNPLAGVKFALEDGEGHFLRELISDTDGLVQVADLAPGNYVIRETEALDGYALTDETLCFTIDEHYAIAEELPRLVNSTVIAAVIQTGVDMIVTPLMVLGGAMVLAAGGIWATRRFKARKKRYK